MVERFDHLGMASLFVPAEEMPRRGPSFSPALPSYRKAKYPALPTHALGICDARMPACRLDHGPTR